MIHKIKEHAITNQVPIMSEQTLECIVQLIEENQYTTVLEFGTAIGYSSLSLANQCPWIAIDTLEKDKLRYHQALANKAALNDQQVNMIFADAKTWPIPKFYDLIIIDAAKAQNQYLFERVLPFVKERGMVVVDNMDFHGHTKHIPLGKNKRNLRQMVTKINKFLQFVQNQEHLKSQLLHVGDGLLIIKRKNV